MRRNEFVLMGVPVGRGVSSMRACSGWMDYPNLGSQPHGRSGAQRRVPGGGAMKQADQSPRKATAFILLEERGKQS